MTRFAMIALLLAPIGCASGPREWGGISSAYANDVCAERDDYAACMRAKARQLQRTVTLEDICNGGATEFTDEHDVLIHCPADQPGLDQSK